MEQTSVNQVIDRVCDEFFREWVEPDREMRSDPNLDRESQMIGYDEVSVQVAERMDANDRSHVVDDARRLLRDAGVDLEGDDFDRFCWALQRTLLRALRTCRDEWEGDFIGRPRGEERAGSGVALGPRKQRRMLSQVIEAWVGDRVAGKAWTSKTAQQIQGEMDQIVLPLLGDRPIDTISRDDIREFRNSIEHLPVRNDPAWKGRTVHEVLEVKPTPGGLAVSTVNRCITHVSSLFKWAVDQEWIDRNPAERMMRTRRRSDRESRQPFTDDDLRALFTAEFRERTLDRGKPGKYWIPLIALYSGARVREIAQLRLADITEHDGIPVIEIREEDGQTLKTAASARKVPVHSGLIGLGFLTYTQRSRARGSKKLFPELPHESANGPGDAVSKFFTRWRKEVGITDKRKVFHSFRHTFITRLKDADVQDHAIAELVGHENDNITTGRYGRKLDVRKLAENLERLEYGTVLDALR